MRAQILDSGSLADRAVVPLLTRSFILARAQQCRAERGRVPNLILTDFYDSLTDFYDSGDLIGAVRELNGLGSEPPAPTIGA